MCEGGGQWAPCLGLAYVTSMTLASFQAFRPSVHLLVLHFYLVYYGWGAHVCHIRG